MSLRRALFLGLYEVFWYFCRLFLALLSYAKPSLLEQTTERDLTPSILATWQNQRQKHKHAAIFFCSSAGEYEQAKPLARRLLELDDYFVLFVFASVSGIRFAKAQKEELAFHKAPWDRPSGWVALCRAVQPDFFVVVRYELWPGFLAIASARAPVYLIDAVRSDNLAQSASARWMWRLLLRSLEHIFAVGSEDRTFYIQVLGQDSQKVSTVGDSKYDRVLERQKEKRELASNLKSQLADFLGNARVLILGSAWPEDLEAFLSVLEEIPLEKGGFKLIVAPHDVSPSMAEGMLRALTAKGLRVCRVSREGISMATAAHDVLLVDAVGYLAELYACAHLAWVGGGMHHRVHNVLEPACHAIYVCFGPFYSSSQEARWMVTQGLAQVVRSGPEFLSWFRQLSWDHQPPHQALWRAVSQQEGASDRILAHILAAHAKQHPSSM